MSGILKRSGHLSVALLAVTTSAMIPNAAAQQPAYGPATFIVLMRGVRVGSEIVDVTKTATGYVISATGQLAPPFDLVTNKFEVAYGADGQPQRLVVEGTSRGQLIALSTTFNATSAVSDMLQGDKRGNATHQISPGAIVLPNNFFGAYEALALRLHAATPGTKIPVYVAPQAEITATVDRITPRRVTTAGGTQELRQFDLTFTNPSGPVGIELWIDQRNRLARLALPAASLTVIREDLSSVMARLEHVRHPRDSDVFIPANGFNLGATITKPEGNAKAAAAVLVGGTGRQDRDETVHGIPIFGQLAGQLADAGLFVVRYDRRSTGQSGGRIEVATLADYANDVLSVVAWLRKRSDVDPNRIALVGYAEGAAVALLAAGREDNIKAVALLAAAGRTGREVTLEQQQRLLSRQKVGDAERQSKTALQTRVIDAAISGKGWEGVPSEIRRQADTPWFRSWLLFDPAAAMRKVEQPVLIIHGAADAEIPPTDADRLEELSRKRDTDAAPRTQKVIVPAANHLLVPAKTGEVDEYASLAPANVAPEIARAIVNWLKDVAAQKSW